ncbi:MAG: ABC transporter ATP-binding protein [Dehalococcoidia bacterium]
MVSVERLETNPAAATVPAIEAAGLRKVYGRTVALEELSLRVEQGEVFGFLGPNGAGKTTTVKILMGLVRPTAGEARIFGRPVDEPEARRRAGYLPENFRFHDWLTGAALLDFHGRLAGMTAADRQRRIPEVIGRVGLAGRGGDRIRGYSKGMTQRIGLAQAILHRPDVVLLDEPTSALDPVGRREVRDLIRSLRADGLTVFINSHLLSEVEMVCDRVAIVARGRVVRAGRLEELLDAASLRVTLDRVDDDLVQTLGGIAPVANVEGTTVTLEAEAEAAPLVAEAVIQAGYRLFGLVPVHRSLEDVFMQLVEEKP